MTSVSLDLSANEVTPTTSAPGPPSSSPCVPDGDRICRVVQSFPRHVTVKLKEETVIQWQHQVKLIIDAYGLTGYIHGTLSIPPRNIADPEGKLTSSPEFLSFHQQDKLLASWILSTISVEIYRLLQELLRRMKSGVRLFSCLQQRPVLKCTG